MDPKSLTPTITYGLISLFGLIFIGIGIYEINVVNSLKQSGVSTNGKVTDVKSYKEKGNTKYKSKIEFKTAKGEIHQATAGKYNIGDMVQLTYLPSKPDVYRVNFKGSINGALTSIGIGSIFSGVFVFLAVLAIRRRKQIFLLFERGTRIQAKVTAVNTIERRTKRGTKRSYTVVAQANNPMTGQLEQFKSHQLTSYPGDSLIGQDVSVLIDPAQPKINYMDLSGY